MYSNKGHRKTSIKVNDSVEGESIEIKMQRLLNNGDETAETKELVYSRPEEGIIANYNIRHDHWDDAAEGATTMAEKNIELDGARLKKREELLKAKKDEDDYLRKHAKDSIKKSEGSQGENPSGEV